MFVFIVWALISVVAIVSCVWAFSPAYRHRIELPKYTFLELERALDHRLNVPDKWPTFNEESDRTS
ncbi:hypothetical protein LMG29542_07614 [Paraburkholderia humisilvae]|uniref:Uncharacterized protein n=1 Tax=Paraburkholderia humisilvae TaxID=627669 RepID=A0A6J5F933_9BURK|nr:hypothetical protein LMG29542_07614 [Paraburkholderia humisilvae]